MNNEPSCVVEEIVEEADHDGKGCAASNGDGDAQQQQEQQRRSTPSSSGASAATATAGDADADADSNAAAGSSDKEQQQQQQQQDGEPPASTQEQQQQQVESAAAAAAAEAAAATPAATAVPEAAAEEQAPPPPWQPADDAERAALAAAEALKAEGNTAFGAGRYEDAAARYHEALAAAPEPAPQRAAYHANLAAAYAKLGQPALAVEQATCALRGDPKYVKALMRRAAAYEALDDPERAAADARAVAELDPGNAWARAAAARLAPLVAAKQEALKAEMLSKLKELGNSVLGRFGLSLDNFKAEQDPDTGGYSIKFQK